MHDITKGDVSPGDTLLATSGDVQYALYHTRLKSLLDMLVEEQEKEI